MIIAAFLAIRPCCWMRPSCLGSCGSKSSHFTYFAILEVLLAAATAVRTVISTGKHFRVTWIKNISIRLSELSSLIHAHTCTLWYAAGRKVLLLRPPSNVHLTSAYLERRLVNLDNLITYILLPVKAYSSPKGSIIHVFWRE